ncbi:hypothetical protein VTO42DRAFT_7987 [Malbranchea cinnamomea]
MFRTSAPNCKRTCCPWFFFSWLLEIFSQESTDQLALQQYTRLPVCFLRGSCCCQRVWTTTFTAGPRTDSSKIQSARAQQRTHDGWMQHGALKRRQSVSASSEQYVLLR